MDVLTSETCWAVNWHNKASVIKLVYLYSNIKMMHGLIHIRWICLVVVWLAAVLKHQHTLQLEGFLYNIQNFASIGSSVWFLYARCIILLLWIPLHDFLWSVPWSPLKAIKLPFLPPLYDVHNFTSVDFQNYIFFRILSRVIFVSLFMMESQISRIPVCIRPYKNEIGITVFEDSCEDNLLPKFNLFTILDGIAQCHVSSLELLWQVYWVTWHWFFVYWNIAMNSIVINSYPMLAFKLSAILDALAL